MVQNIEVKVKISIYEDESMRRKIGEHIHWIMTSSSDKKFYLGEDDLEIIEGEYNGIYEIN